MGNQIQMLGFYGAGFLCLALAVVKLTLAVPWSWWRVLLPLWVVLGHNALYIILGFVWLFFADNRIAEEEVTLREDNRSYFTNGRECSVSLSSSLTWLDEWRDIRKRVWG